MKILDTKASLDEQKTVFISSMASCSNELKSVVSNLVDTAENKLKGILATIEDLMSEVIELEKQKQTLTHEVNEMADMRKAQQQRKEELEEKARELSTLEGELAEERKLIDTKKEQLADKERQLDKQKSFWDERLKNYKIAEPNNG